MKKVAVVGLGYVGLPLAILAKEKGWEVMGLDTDAAKVDQINRGISPIDGERVARDLKKYQITATTDPALVADAGVIIVAVPTPVTKDHLPDLTPLQTAIENIRPHLRTGQVLVVESTINPGVMDELVLPLLRQRADLNVDADEQEGSLYVAHCPERINPGDTKWSVRNIPRVLGGYSPAGVAAAAAFYESVIEAPVKVMASITEAEAVKILENTFRDINIAFVNEMARSFARLDIDITHVIEGAATKPFAFMAHYPGNGVGGHCISVDPYYMIERGRQAGFDHKFLKLARQINNDMPAYTVNLLEQGLASLGLKLTEATVALLGLAYKKDIADLRESPALAVRQLLEKRAAALQVFDPFVPKQSTVASLDGALAGVSALMLATNHTVFTATLTPQKIKEVGIRIVVDGKNALDGEGIAAVGIPYFGVGRKFLPRA